MHANPYGFFKLTTLPQHLYIGLSQRRSLYVALTAGAHPYSPDTSGEYTRFPRVEYTQPALAYARASDPDTSRERGSAA